MVLGHRVCGAGPPSKPGPLPSQHWQHWQRRRVLTQRLQEHLPLHVWDCGAAVGLRWVTMARQASSAPGNAQVAPSCSHSCGPPRCSAAPRSGSRPADTHTCTPQTRMGGRTAAAHLEGEHHAGQLAGDHGLKRVVEDGQVVHPADPACSRGEVGGLGRGGVGGKAVAAGQHRRAWADHAN